MSKLEAPSRGIRQNMAKSVTIGDLNRKLLDHKVRFRILNAELYKRN